MRVKIEKFLKSNWYLTLVFGFAWLIWSIRGPKIDNQFYLVNVIGLIVLAVMFLLVSAFFENAFYTIPIILALAFSINTDYIRLFAPKNPYIITIGTLIFLGMVINTLRFKVKTKPARLTLGLFLLGVFNVIPLSYYDLFPGSLVMGLVWFYLFFLYTYFRSHTTKVTIHDFMKILYAVSIFFILCSIVSIYFYLDWRMNKENIGLLKAFKRGFTNHF